MRRRQRRRTLVILTAFAAGLLPSLLLAGVWYWQTVSDADARRQHYAGVALERADKIFGSVNAAMHELATQIDPQCDAKTQAALAQAAYNSLYFRQAALLSDGRLQCAGEELAVSPAVRIPPDLPQSGADILIVAPGTLLPKNPSIVTLYPMQPGVSLALLIDPARLSESLQPMLQGEQVSVSVSTRSGARLVRYGEAFAAHDDPPASLRSTSLTSAYFPIVATVATSRAWALRGRGWSAVLDLALGLAISGLLFFFGRQWVQRLLSADSELRDALAHDEFEVHYQPVIDLGSGACVGAEALLRWHHPERGMVLPDKFIPTADKSGFVVVLTAWLMQRVADEMRGLLAANPGYHVSLNLSARHILDPGLLDTIRRTFTDGLSPQRIIFEITEQELLRGSHDDLLAVIHQLRTTGAGLALDDFGTGYASLKYLTQFRFDYLKIDRFFVQSIGRNALNAGLVDAIVDIAKRMQLGIVAEGIETPEQLDYVKKLGVRLGQGWLFSKAMPAQQFIDYVARQAAAVQA